MDPYESTSSDLLDDDSKQEEMNNSCCCGCCKSKRDNNNNSKLKQDEIGILKSAWYYTLEILKNHYFFILLFTGVFNILIGIKIFGIIILPLDDEILDQLKMPELTSVFFIAVTLIFIIGVLIFQRALAACKCCRGCSRIPYAVILLSIWILNFISLGIFYTQVPASISGCEDIDFSSPSASNLLAYATVGQSLEKFKAPRANNSELCFNIIGYIMKFIYIFTALQIISCISFMIYMSS